MKNAELRVRVERPRLEHVLTGKIASLCCTHTRVRHQAADGTSPIFFSASKPTGSKIPLPHLQVFVWCAEPPGAATTHRVRVVWHST